MKRYTIGIITLLLIVGCSKQVDETTLIEKDGLMHLPNSDKPYTGEVLGNYMTGEKAYTGKYIKGLLVDKYSYYQKNGFKKEPLNINYLIERTNVVYEMNALESLTGLVFDLWENGEIKIWGLYKYGLKNGKWDYLRQNGSIHKSEIYHHGKIKESSDFYDNEKLKYSGTYEDGGKVGEWDYIDANGYNYKGSPIKPNNNSSGVFMFVDDSFSEYSSYTNGQKNGSYIKWNNNGQKMEEGKYHFPRFIFGGYDTTLTKSYRIGKWRHFHNNGILKEEGSYRQRASYNLYDNGKPYNIRPSEYKNDWWTYYHDVDIKSAEGKYIYGEKDSLWTYWYTNGQKLSEGTFKDGKLDGLYTGWYDNGQKVLEGTFKDGKKDGLYTLWDENGQKMKEGSTKDENVYVNAFKSVFVIDGKFNCFDGSKSTQGNYVNDGDCDCSDCSDEPFLIR